jgi:RHS repeat-associated protein
MPSAELDSSGNVTAQFIGNIMYKNGTVYQLIMDHLGSVRLVIDKSSGAIAQQLDYDEFGNVLSDSNPDFQPFGYAGGLYDSQTKLVRFGARDYDASVGRWQSKEPFGFAGSNNFYSYSLDDPINLFDKNGLLVEVYYEYIGGSTIDRLAAEAYGSLHAFIHVKTENFDAVIEMIGGGIPRLTPFDQSRAAQAEKHDVKRPCPDVGDSFENEILKEYFTAVDNPNLLPPYTNKGIDPTDPTFGVYFNSNTFANFLIRGAGGSIIDIPSNAFGSWGIRKR